MCGIELMCKPVDVMESEGMTLAESLRSLRSEILRQDGKIKEIEHQVGGKTDGQMNSSTMTREFLS